MVSTAQSPTPGGTLFSVSGTDSTKGEVCPGYHIARMIYRVVYILSRAPLAYRVLGNSDQMKP